MIALTSIVMKCFEHVLKYILLKYAEASQDKNQYAYKKYRSTRDTCTVLDFLVRQHIETPNSYSRVGAYCSLTTRLLSTQFYQL